MKLDRKKLTEEVNKNLFRLCTVEELAQVFSVDKAFVREIKEASDSPFYRNKCQPVLFMEWIRAHTKFQQTQSSPSAGQPSPSEQCAEAVRAHLQVKPLLVKKETRTNRVSQ